jgi:hypothetical protein
MHWQNNTKQKSFYFYLERKRKKLIVHSVISFIFFSRLGCCFTAHKTLQPGMSSFLLFDLFIRASRMFLFFENQIFCFYLLAAAAAGTSSETGYVATFTVVSVSVEVATAIVVIFFFFTSNGNAVNRPAPGVFFARSVPSPRQFLHHFLSNNRHTQPEKNHFESNRGPNKTLLEMYINDSSSVSHNGILYIHV